MLDLGILIIRLVLGLSFVGHGAQKLFGWFGGPGLKNTAGFFESTGIKPGFLMAVLAGLSELLGGLLFAAGLLTPLAGLIIAGTMVIAIATVHGKNGYWATQNGYEYNLLIMAVSIGTVLIGSGAYGLDALIFG
ncbi:DoxX family protein [Sporolactobacillus sp. CPB3-1]|uniref:DoxX family protein n=1 Tax=Sporolactobacillus mangiferae TaxID=2940498 RepID=A0ABT0M7G1_9BACL|nr:DoxX family protein [Sporolactobacillus mangiferae]MCL1630800.1 DoxX family protein [Sporolactobacillus mangiferae]